MRPPYWSNWRWKFDTVASIAMIVKVTTVKYKFVVVYVAPIASLSST